MSKRGQSHPIDNYSIEPFFEVSADLFCIAGFDGFLKRVNPAVVRTLGYTEEELLSRPINEFIHPADRDVTEGWRSSLRRNKPLLNFENRYINSNGSIVWLSWTSMPLPEEELVYAIAKDITYKKKIEEERNKLLRFLASDNKNLRQLMYTTSHDLRSPVNSLLMVLSLLETAIIKNSEALDLLDILKAGTDHLKNTLNNYVDVLMKKEGFVPKLELVDLSECFNKVISSVNSLIESSGTILEADFSDLPQVKFNTAYMESVFLNLITNSIKYARPGLRPEITIRSLASGGRKHLIISDNGQGFDMEKVGDKLFKMSQTFHEQQQDSKGLGLYLVYEHVTSLGGVIEATSKVNQGTKFTITFDSH